VGREVAGREQGEDEVDHRPVRCRQGVVGVRDAGLQRGERSERLRADEKRRLAAVAVVHELTEDGVGVVAASGRKVEEVLGVGEDEHDPRVPEGSDEPRQLAESALRRSGGESGDRDGVDVGPGELDAADPGLDASGFTPGLLGSIEVGASQREEVAARERAERRIERRHRGGALRLEECVEERKQPALLASLASLARRPRTATPTRARGAELREDSTRDHIEGVERDVVRDGQAGSDEAACLGPAFELEDVALEGRRVLVPDEGDFRA
jgi:hypothetical protein